MKVTILAANGQIAHLVENEILTNPEYKDVELSLMLRNKNRLNDLADDPRVTLFEGDLNKLDDVVAATKDADLVWSAVVDHDAQNRPTKNVIEAAKQNGFKRHINTSLLGIYDEVSGAFGKWNRDTCFNGDPTGSAPTVADEMLEKSDLDNTTLRLPWLNDRDEVKYKLTHRHDTYYGVSGSRKSMADVVLKIIADPSFASNDSLGIADPDTEGSDRPVY